MRIQEIRKLFRRLLNMNREKNKMTTILFVTVKSLKKYLQMLKGHINMIYKNWFSLVMQKKRLPCVFFRVM